VKRAGALALAGALLLAGLLWRTWGEAPAVARLEAPVPLAGAVPAALSPQRVEAFDPGAPLSTLPASLRDTEADGSWRADARGHLVLERAVRRRFDYWLSALGEATPEALAPRVLEAARRELPTLAADEVADLWARYLALQRHAWQRAVQPADPASWRTALEERQSVRRQTLGREAAEAFYGDEERALWDEILAREAGRPAPAQAEVQAPEHPQAAERVAEVEAQWADWERRLAAARVELARLRGAPELSAPQRAAAVDTWLARHFKAGEQIRVRALLGLPAV
jgi:lipase chaperone LimK